jgi:hypothetical protein
MNLHEELSLILSPNAADRAKAHERHLARLADAALYEAEDATRRAADRRRRRSVAARKDVRAFQAAYKAAAHGRFVELAPLDLLHRVSNARRGVEIGYPPADLDALTAEMAAWTTAG